MNLSDLKHHKCYAAYYDNGNTVVSDFKLVTKNIDGLHYLCVEGHFVPENIVWTGVEPK